jgi:hypothetical protein
MERESEENEGGKSRSDDISTGKELILRVPKIKKGLKIKYVPKKELPEYNPYKINLEMYELISAWVKGRGIKFGVERMRYINSLFPDKPDLYSHYLEFEKSYKERKKIEENQKNS